MKPQLLIILALIAISTKHMKKIYIALLSLLLCNAGYAQLNPLIAQYFNNRYLANPAYAGAGAGAGLNINANYRKQWANIPGSPELQNLALDYGINRSGIGLNIELDKTGLQRQTRVVGSYAYHVPLKGEGHRISFGLSIGFMDQRLSNSDISGNPDDPAAAEYGTDTKVDGDFGMVYTNGKFSIEAALPNLNFLFKGSEELKVANLPTFYSALSYKFALSGGHIGLEPRVVFRGVKGFDNLIDVGANVSLLNEQLVLMGMYHSNESASFGVGLNLKKRYLISGSYTTQTSALSSYANGSFEIGLKVKVGK